MVISYIVLTFHFPLSTWSMTDKFISEMMQLLLMYIQVIK